MSYTVLLGEVVIQCDTPDEAFDLAVLAQERMSRLPSVGRELQPAGSPPAQGTPSDISYWCPACGKERQVAARFRTKEMRCECGQAMEVKPPTDPPSTS